MAKVQIKIELQKDKLPKQYYFLYYYAFFPKIFVNLHPSSITESMRQRLRLIYTDDYE